MQHPACTQDGHAQRAMQVPRVTGLRRRGRLRLEAAQQRTEAASRLKSQLLAGVAHSLRGLLLGITGYASALWQELTPPTAR
jgi:signal transduction histidine kinase